MMVKGYFYGLIGEQKQNIIPIAQVFNIYY